VAQSIDGAPVAGLAPRIAFNPDDRLSGSGGCNTLSAVYEAEAGAITVRALGATEMACDDAVMRQEAAFLALLGEASRYQRDDARLTLADEAGRNIVFVPAA
jgi:putative lipoprotein